MTGGVFASTEGEGAGKVEGTTVAAEGTTEGVLEEGAIGIAEGVSAVAEGEAESGLGSAGGVGMVEDGTIGAADGTGAAEGDGTGGGAVGSIQAVRAVLGVVPAGQV